MRRALEAAGYQLIDEDSHTWAFALTDDDVPITVPRRVRLLPVPIMSAIYGGCGKTVKDAILHEALAESTRNPSTAPTPDDN